MLEGIRAQLAALRKAIAEAKPSVLGPGEIAGLPVIIRPGETTDEAVIRTINETGPPGSPTRWRPRRR